MPKFSLIGFLLFYFWLSWPCATVAMGQFFCLYLAQFSSLGVYLANLVPKDKF
jgi:hypothetical protein